MVSNAFFASTVLCMALGFYLLGECSFLIPYRHLIVAQYGTTIAGFTALLFLNVFAAMYVLGRKLFLKDTGRKLAHVEKQLRSGESISDELSKRIAE